MHSAFALDEEHKDNCFVVYNLTIANIDGSELEENVLVYDDETKILTVEAEIRPDTVTVSYLLVGRVNGYEDYANGLVSFDVEI